MHFSLLVSTFRVCGSGCDGDMCNMTDASQGLEKKYILYVQGHKDNDYNIMYTSPLKP